MDNIYMYIISSLWAIDVICKQWFSGARWGFFISYSTDADIHSWMWTHPYECTHIHPTSMSTFERLGSNWSWDSRSQSESISLSTETSPTTKRIISHKYATPISCLWNGSGTSVHHDRTIIKSRLKCSKTRTVQGSFWACDDKWYKYH
jgi:hypothetical protein